ncbi:MAG: ABC transporter ATP-binding protein, partial [Pseudomonadota bacterium]
GFFQKMKSGQLLSRVISDATVMRSSVAESLMGVGKNSITLLILIGVMFYQDWKLTLIALVVFPLAAIFVMKLGRRLRKVSSHAQHELGDLSTDLTQAFQGVRHVKAYGMIEHENDRVNNGVERIFKLTVKGFRVSALATPLSEMLSGLAIVTIIVYGGYQVIAGESTAGQLFSFITAFLLAYEPMKRLAKLNNILQIGLAAADRIFNILDIEPHVKDEPDAKPLVTDNYTVSFENVSFSYPDGTEALEDVNISAPSGKTIALVGSSGSGKSTIINLIPRFYDVQAGAVKIGGTDIRDVSLKSLRSNMALVSQEVTIFNDTLHDNIAYGTPQATREQVIEAAKSAAAHDFIVKLPEGYDTIVGEQGVKLSGGQRQRVAIARAMLRNAPILLLDEATSALDTESERLVQNALDRLREGRTTLVVAHRMSTIKNADYIYVLQGGKVVEEGGHNQLLIQKGVYSKLYGMDFKETA